MSAENALLLSFMNLISIVFSNLIGAFLLFINNLRQARKITDISPDG
ncbi:hypothetical protein JXO59_08620 [candidate division KSB1 bacterium]|nr:hypothetical protein [candidate division KSB1 bacterium]